MKKLLLLMVILSLLLVACDSNKEVKAEAVEPEVVVVADDLKDLEAVKAFFDAQTASGYLLEESFEALYFDVTGNGVEELLIRNESGGLIPVVTVSDEGQYTLLNSTVKASSGDVITVEGAFIVVDSNKDLGFNKMSVKTLYNVQDLNIIALIDGEITVSKTEMLDRILKTSTMLTTMVVNTDQWNNFDVESTVVYVDEFGTSHDYQHDIATYTLKADATGYEVAKVDSSAFLMLDSLVGSLKYYGEDEGLMTFEAVIAESDFETAIHYYAENRLNFVKGAKEAYADAMMEQLKAVFYFFDGYSFDQFENIEVTETEEGLALDFIRNNGTMTAKEQSVVGYYKTYAVTPDGVEENGYQIAFKDQILSKEIYQAMTDSKMNMNTNKIIGMMVHEIGFEGYQTSSVIVPNVQITSAEDVLLFEGAKKSNLLLPLILLNDPIELVSITSLKEGSRIAGMKVTYLQIDDDHYNVNLQGKIDFEGIFSYDKEKVEYYINLDQEAQEFLYHDFGGQQLRENFLSGKKSVIEGEKLVEFVGQEVMDRVLAGEEVEVAGTIWLAMFAGSEFMEDGPSAIAIKDLYTK